MALLIDDIKTELQCVGKYWRLSGRPTVCLLIREEHMRDPQFKEMLDLLAMLKKGYCDGMKVRIGRLQNLVSSSCIEHLDFMNQKDLSESETAFTQINHEYIGYQSLTDVPKAHTYIEETIKCDDYLHKPNHEIIEALRKTESIYCLCQLWGILLNREGPNYEVNGVTVNQALMQIYYRAGSLRYWRAVRYCSSLLHHIVSSISPFITAVLVNGKQLTVGVIGQKETVFDKPMTPAEIQSVMYTTVQPYDVIQAVLQQEVVLYCGRLIATNSDVFRGTKVDWRESKVCEYTYSPPYFSVNFYNSLALLEKNAYMGDWWIFIVGCLQQARPTLAVLMSSVDLAERNTRSLYLIGWVLEAMRIYLKISGQEKIDLDNLSPFQVRILLQRVLTVSEWANDEKLTTLQRRQLEGSLCRVPKNFYNMVWDVLQRTPEGIKVQGRHLPAIPTLTHLSRGELTFSLLVEETLICIARPERRQLVVELLCIIATILSRNPELRFQQALDLDEILEEAFSMYCKVNSMPATKDMSPLFSLPYSGTTGYLARAAVNKVLQGGALSPQDANEIHDETCKVS